MIAQALDTVFIENFNKYFKRANYMKLRELFKPKTNPEQVKWLRATPHEEYQAEFVYEQYTYTLDFYHTDDDEDSGKEIWLVEFQVRRVDKKPIKNPFGIQGDVSRPVEPLAKIIDITRQFMSMTPDVILYFSAIEPSRIKLYNTMVRRLVGTNFKSGTLPDGATVYQVYS